MKSCDQRLVTKKRIAHLVFNYAVVLKLLKSDVTKLLYMMELLL